ncbi:MAG TPA: cupin domain-containing protein [Clostridia bacterium]|nr:cupin domain-containing protein [Clostridia bacterium]
MVEILKPDFEFTDERGKLVQLVREGYKQVNVVHSKADTFRGGHCHEQNKETFYIIEGSCKLTARKDGIEEQYTFGAGDMFAIEALVYHDFHYLTDTLLVAMYDNGIELENGTKDIVAE